MSNTLKQVSDEDRLAAAEKGWQLGAMGSIVALILAYTFPIGLLWGSVAVSILFVIGLLLLITKKYSKNEMLRVLGLGFAGVGSLWVGLSGIRGWIVAGSIAILAGIAISVVAYFHDKKLE